jgi:hypothetical protein
MALTRIYGNLITTGTMTGNIFQNQSITGDKIAIGTISSNLLASGVGSYSAGGITGNLIGTNAISSNNFNTVANNAISGKAVAMAMVFGAN